MSPGKTYLMSGTQLNGLTEGSYYGDDVNAAVNFPVVRIVNNSSSNVYYAKTFNHSTRSIAPNAVVQTNFTVASGTALGASKLYDVGAGIASAGTPITVRTSCSPIPTTSMPTARAISPGGTAAAHRLLADERSAVSSTGTVGGVPTTWSIVGQRDFNGDGKADLLWLDTSGNIAMWFMNGAQVVAVASATVGACGRWPASPISTATAWATSSGATRRRFRHMAHEWCAGVSGGGLGTLPTTGAWPAPAISTATAWPTSCCDTTSGDLGIWFMNGTRWRSRRSPAATAGWSVVGTGDFNGDGMERHSLARHRRDVAIWLMNGAAVLQAGVGNVATNWSSRSDRRFNGDGKSDPVARHWRHVAMWFMNGTAVCAVSGSARHR